MNTALKLNKKQLFELYEKSSETVKENLRKEFGEKFFVPGKAKPEVIMIRKPKNTSNKMWSLNWELIFDSTTILRLAIYGGLLWIIF